LIKEFRFLPGEIKNVLANSSVAFSRISRVILKIRPITGGTRLKPRILKIYIINNIRD